MRGRIITSSHRVYDLPVLLRWNMTYTGSVPCDSYTVTCVYDKTMAEPLHLAAGFLALGEDDQVLLRGIVDEYAVELSPEGLTVTICGRGYAARLLDNESRPVTYQGATLEEIVRCHVTPYGITAAEIAPVSATSVYTVASGRRWRASAGRMGALRPASGGTGCWWRRRSGTTGGASSSVRTARSSPALCGRTTTAC